MSRTLNKVMLIGNVGKEPELKYTPSGIPVTSFRLATSETWKDKDGSAKEHTDWHTIVAWRGLAEVINKLVTKGSRVYIEGRIQTRTFDDKNGTKRYVVEILADNMLILEQKKSKDDIENLDSEYFSSSSSENESFELDDFNDDLFLTNNQEDLNADDDSSFKF